MILGILVMITALSISAVAIYYSVSGLVAIFAAAAIPIMIMGGVLEVGKLVTAVWLHRYWHQAKWWLRTYLSLATVILMFITSMGIFGFLSKAHIEQTASAQEGLALLERIESELDRQDEIIAVAEQRIVDLESTVNARNQEIQAQIDREQARIDSAYERIQPAIDEQNAVIASARNDDASRTEPYEQQLISLDAELQRLDAQAVAYEERIAQLSLDNSAIEPLINQISTINASITKVEGQIASGEREQIRQAQNTIGANPDGAAGPNTRRAANAWIEQQQSVIAELQAQITDLRAQAQQTLDSERERLTGLVQSIRGVQTESIKSRQLEVLAVIDQVRSAESPVIIRARDEIARLRAGAEEQIQQSNELIQQLRESLTIGKDPLIEQEIQNQQQKIIEANNTIDTLTERKYNLQAEYRKLEAEVGPVKYLAELVYGDTNQDLLEEAVRWVIITIIFVFDPLAVLLLIASQATFEMRRQERLRLEPAEEKSHDNTNRPNDGGNDWKAEYARSYSGGDSNSSTSHSEYDNPRDQEHNRLFGASDDRRVLPQRLLESQQQARRLELEKQEDDVSWRDAKAKWKKANPNMTLKFVKDQYINGDIDLLPWEKYYGKHDKS